MSSTNSIPERSLPEDPNNIPPSPTLSALQRLSILQYPPTASSTGSRTPTQETAELPHLATSLPAEAPPVPSKLSLRSLAQKSKSGSSVSAIHAATAAPREEASQRPKSLVSSESKKSKSKLSTLASSRSSASSSSSVTSASSLTTYPMLRPSSASIGLFEGDSARTSITTSSSMSSHVRRAIETALQLEAVDATPKIQIKDLPPPPNQTASVTHSASPKECLGSPPATQASPRTISQSAVPQLPAPSGGKPKVSKLARLAQAKAQQSQGPWMPKPKRHRSETSDLTAQKAHTEYLTPIANGPTATTAITTTYQSLASLARPSRSDPDPHGTVDMFAPRRSSAEPKHSKLAAKSRRAQQIQEAQPAPEPEPALSALDLPMFTPMNMQSRASPSAFASLLLSDEPSPLEAKLPKTKHKESTRAREHREVVEKPRRRMHKRNEIPLPPGPKSSSQDFAFDVPSPDDIVFRARSGTSLAHRSSSTATHLPASTPSASSSRTTVSSRS